MAKFTNEQLRAIESENTNELVNAGAGSGKTSVIGEHFVYLMKKLNYEVKDILVVTFTVDAANEMKDRIKKTLISNGLNDKVKDLDSSNIQTFDSFNNFILTKYGHKIGVENFSVLDGAYEKVKISNFIDEIFALKYEENNQEFIDMCLRLSLKKDNDIRKFIKNIVLNVNKKENAIKFLDEYVDKFVSEQFINNLFDKYYDEIKKCINYVYNEFDKVDLKDDVELCKKAIYPFIEATTYDELVKLAPNFKLPRKKNDDKYNYQWQSDLRKSLTALIKEKIDLLLSFGLETDIKKVYVEQRKYIEIIIDVVKEVLSKLNTFKDETHLYNFDDIAFKTIHLLKMDDVRKDVRNYFKYIMIDEYQDTSDVQETIVSLIEDNNVFMVGDVKQSIYRFRGANCNIFDNKYQRYKDNNGGHKIDMTKNFRSRKEIIEDINGMFMLLMTKDNNPIDYFDGHIASYGLTKYDEYNDKNLNYGISEILYDKKAFENKSESEIEAHIIAEDIINKINNHVKIYDKEIDDYRNIKFKDFTIICDRGTNFDTFKKVFNEYKLPLYIHSDKKIDENDVTIVFKNLLIVLDSLIEEKYDEQFIYSLCSIYRSFLIGYDDEKIYHLIKNKQYFKDDVLIKIITLKDKINTLNLKQTIYLLAEEFDFEEKLITIGDMLDNQYIFDYLCSLANTFDEQHLKLKDLINFFKNIQKEQIDIKASPIRDIDDSILIINIHKSKGREYPICYFPCLTPSFYNEDSHETYVLSNTMGLCLGGFYNDDRKSLSRYEHIRNEKNEENKEKLRLLYVAFTRARECAIIVKPDKINTNKQLVNCSNMYSILSLANNFIPRDKQYKNELTYPSLSSETTKDETFILKQIKDICYEVKENKKASKELNDNANEEILKTGQKLHYLLELTDISTKNVDFIKDANERKIIQRVINNDVFNIDGFIDIIHEYNYEDKINNINGVIDCLLIGKDEIRIIDFKLKNINDSEYDEQLKTYKKYITQVSDNKKVTMYLLSIVDNITREVKDE